MLQVKTINKLFFGLAVGVVFCLGSYIGVKAASYPGTVYGRASWVGYFTGTKDTNLGGAPGDAPYVLPIMLGVLAIPNDIDTPAEFIGMLKTYNLQTGKKKVGSAFIVNTMLGRNAPGSGDTTVSEADWNTLTAILDYLQAKAGGIVWNGLVDNAPLNINSYYQGVGAGPNPNDDAFYADNKNESGIIFNNGDGTSYRLLRRCANPVGILSGLTPVIPKQWSLHATSTNNTAGTAKPGDTIIWSHSLINDGADATTAAVHSNLGITGFSNGWGTTGEYGGGDSPAGSGLGTIRTITDYATYGVVQADVGHTLCEKVQFDPSNSVGGRDGRGNDSCVYIAPNWNITATSTINRTTAAPGDKIIWAHNLNNEGPTYTTAPVHSNLGITGFSNGWGTTGEYGGGDSPSGSGLGTIRTITDYATYGVVQADVGNNLCEKVQFDPSNSAGGRDGRGNDSCVGIPYNFSLTAETAIKDDNSAPGLSISFNYKLTNQGPTKVNKNVDYSTSMSRVSSIGYPSFTAAHTASAKIEPDVGYPSIGSTATGNNDGSPKSLADFKGKSHTINQDDVGNWICGIIAVNPHSSADSSDTFSYSCKFIPYKYTLTPTVTVNPSGIIEDGTSFTIRANINNNGGTVSEPATWDLAESTTKPISNTSLGSAVVTFKENSDTVVQNIAVTASGEPGKHYCYILSVTPHSSEDPSKINSSQVCVTIGKKPKVQIWGGDLISGGNVTSSTSIKNNFMFGSWVEYGIFSAGLIKGTASGSAFAGESGLSDASICKYSILSFANADNSTCTDSTIKGKYAYSSLGSLSGVAASFPITSLTPLANSNLDNLQGIYKATGGLTISGGNIKKSQWIVINASDENITINGNIAYTNETLKNINEIPQVVIIANNINIADNVTQVDAWLIVKGSLNTCSSIDGTNLAPAAKLDVGMCKQKLMINGPVSAGRLYLRRTAGSGTGTASGDPAEVFNLRADAYLWATARAASDSKIQTVYTTELPPRF